MTLHEYMDLLRRSWLTIVVATALGSLLGLAASMLTTPTYQAQAQLFVSVQSADEVSSAYSGGLFVQQRIKSYVDVVDTPGVLDPVVDELGLDTTGAALAESVSAEASPNTVLLNVTATGTDPDQVAALANATAESLGSEIERLETTESGAKPVNAELIRPAQAPATPVSPNTRLNLLLGTFLGLGIGVGIALLRHTLDTTIKTTQSLEEATGAITLGVVLNDPDARANPLVTLPDSPRAEAFRTIRTNLRYIDVDNPPRSVVITSSMPGEGKSTTACNLAIAMAKNGSKVLLIEADLRRPKVADYLGVDGSIGLTDILIGQSTPDTAILSWQRGLLDFLPSGAIPPNPSELLGSHQMAGLLQGLVDRYDVIILDAPPLLLVSDAAIMATAADGAIMVVRYGTTSREQAADATEALRHVGARVLGTALNFAPTKRRGGYGYGYGYGEKGDQSSGRRVLGDDDVPAPDIRA